jgi:hypothetical protein
VRDDNVQPVDRTASLALAWDERTTCRAWETEQARPLEPTVFDHAKEYTRPCRATTEQPACGVRGAESGKTHWYSDESAAPVEAMPVVDASG